MFSFFDNFTNQKLLIIHMTLFIKNIKWPKTLFDICPKSSGIHNMSKV